MDARSVSLDACAARVCSFFAAMAAELEAHEEIEQAIDEAEEQRVNVWAVLEVLIAVPLKTKSRKMKGKFNRNGEK